MICITARRLLAGFAVLALGFASPGVPAEGNEESAMIQGDRWSDVVTDLQARFPERAGERVAVVSVTDQTLDLLVEGIVTRSYPISTSMYGIGAKVDSGRTPLGVHRIRRKIGEDLALGSVLKAREPTGEIAHIETRAQTTGKDHVTTRILWLDGLEPGLNKGEGVDSFKRFIYIHGTHEEGLIGRPASHGCVRMLNRDVVELFDALPLDSLVVIVE